MTDVTLQSNGDYWKARWIDPTGHRRSKSIGPKNKLSQRQAETICRRLAAEMIVNPSRASQGQSPRLGDYLKLYLDQRTDIADNTKANHTKTVEYLTRFFDKEIRIASITRVAATQWRTWLAEQDITETTVCNHVRTAKVIFNHALRMDLIPFNPFDRLKGTAPKPAKDWQYVSTEDFEKLLGACPDAAWRVLLGLCRLAGLRRGEALRLEWKNVSFGNNQITVYANKTKKYRTLPIVPRLMQMLVEAFEIKGSLLVAPVRQHNLHKNINELIRRAGLAPWPDPFQVLRRNCETDWAQTFPQYVVSAWLGHDISVSQDFYLQVPKELYEKASCFQKPPPNQQQNEPQASDQSSPASASK